MVPQRRYVARVTAAERVTIEFLRRALARAEVSVAHTRLVVLALMVAEEAYFLARRPALANTLLGWMPTLVMVAGALVTAAALRTLRRSPGAAYRVSVALDAGLILGVSLPPALAPGADYHGAFHHATFPFLLVAIAASALRVNRRVVRLSIGCNVAAGLVLTGVDRVVGKTPAASPEEWVLWIVAFTAVGLIADAAAHRARRLVYEGANAAVRAERAQHALGTYVSETVAQEAMAGADPTPGGKRRAVAILFSDLRGFSAYASVVPPERLVDELNAYFEGMVAVIRAEGGVVDKYIGDAIMVLFGVPVQLPDAASRALRAAVAMQRALLVHNAARVQAGLPALAHDIGVHYGEVVVGNIGTPEHMQYTAIGDAVNVASALQQAARDHDVGIVVSASVADVTGPIEGLPALRPLGPLSIKGRATPVHAYAIDRV